MTSKVLRKAAKIAERIECLENRRDKLLRSMELRWDIPVPRMSEAINKILAEETGRINPEINSRILRTLSVKALPVRSESSWIPLETAHLGLTTE